MAKLLWCVVLILLAQTQAKSMGGNLRRNILETEANFVPSKEGDLEQMLDRGEDKTKSRKVHKDKGMTGVDLAKKAHLKSLDEHDVQLDVTTIEEKPGETLSDKSTGVVDKAVEKAEQTKAEKKLAKKNGKVLEEKDSASDNEDKKDGDGKKVKKEKKTKGNTGSTKSSAMLTLHECGKTQEMVAYIIPTKEVPLEISVGYLISFDRMGYNDQGDLKFVFETQEALNRMMDELPRLLKVWRVEDENVHRLSVVLKENAIVLKQKEVNVLSRAYGASFNGGVGDSTRFQRSCERLLGLAAVIDNQPCDYKYAVFAPSSGRFLPRPKPEDQPKGLFETIKSAIGLGTPEKEGVRPLAGVVNLGDRRLREKKLKEDKLNVEENKKDEEEKPKDKKPKQQKIEEAKVEAEVTEELKALPKPVRLMDMVLKSNFVWGHDCSQNNKAAEAAVRRMRTNAFIFAGGKVSSPRYQKAAHQTANFTLFTLQSQLPIVDMKDKAVRFLLELFRSSNANPANPPTTFRSLVTVTLGQIPSEVAIDLSDVLLFQYYNMLRDGLTVTNSNTVFPDVPMCSAGNAALLDAASHLETKDKQVQFAAKVRPLMIPKSMVDAGVFNQATIVYDQEATDNEFQSIY